MAQHRSSRSAIGNSTPVKTVERATEVTDIIPFNEFGDFADLDFLPHAAFDRESQVIGAPELDDMHDTDDLVPLTLEVPTEFRTRPRAEQRATSRLEFYADSSAPEGALYLDGKLVGWLPHVTRL